LEGKSKKERVSSKNNKRKKYKKKDFNKIALKTLLSKEKPK